MPAAKSKKTHSEDDTGVDNKRHAGTPSPKVALPTKDTKVLVHFNSHHSLVILLEGITSLLSDCTFNIAYSKSTSYRQSDLSTSVLSDDEKRDDFNGFYLEALDLTRSCIVIAKLEAHVTINEKDPPDPSDMSFCVSVGTFLTHVKSISANCCVQLYRTTSSADLHIKTFSASGRHNRLMTIGTLNKESATFGVNNLEYPFTVQLDLAELRGIIKTATLIHCKNFRTRILESKDPTKTRRSYFIIHLYGDNSYDEHCFLSLTDVTEGKSTLVIKNSDFLDDDEQAVVTLDDLDEKFNNIFPVEYMHSFLKALEKQTVTIRFAQDRPMTISSSLGDEQSFLTYLLAPKTDVDTLPNLIQTFGAK
jgi:hypothetical protein